MTDMWDAIPVTPVRDSGGFTINPYATFGPAYMPDVSWHDFFYSIRLGRSKEINATPEEDDDDVTAGETVITREAEEFDDPCSPLAKKIALAHRHGWDIATLAHSFAFEAGKITKSGKNAGRKAPDKEWELQWVFLEKEGVGRAVVAYHLAGGVVNGTLTRRSFNGTQLSDTAFNEALKGA